MPTRPRTAMITGLPPVRRTPPHPLPPRQPWHSGIMAAPVLVADQAHTATGHLGPCAVCGWALLTGDRAARLVDGTGRWCHVAGCAAKL